MGASYPLGRLLGSCILYAQRTLLVLSLSFLMVHCAGCHSNFSASGYTHHLRQTQSTSCTAAYYAQLEHENDVEIVGDADDMPEFSGDFFGNYEDEDLDWPDNEGMSTE